jgi:AcrR family transcriptional regulator
MPRPKSVSPGRLAQAALAVIDRDGLAGLTMRAVAAELGLTTMAVYRYVADRVELEALVVEEVLRTLDTTEPAAQPWTEQLRILTERVRAAVGDHPGVVPLLVSHRHRSAGVLRWSETVVGVLHAAGFTGTRRVVALRGLLSYVIGALQLEHLGPLAGGGTVTISELADHPRLAETARHARRVGPDEEFAEGLSIMMRGLAVRAPDLPVRDPS